MGKPKVLLLILRKRLFMDKTKDVFNYYTINGIEDNHDDTILERVLTQMMRNCLNFIQKDTILQNNACKMVEHRYNIIVERTPKCHPKLADEGIQYSWGCENNSYRQLLLDRKKGKKLYKKTPRGYIRRQPYHKDASMLYICAPEYSIAYKLMSHREHLVGLYINLFTPISIHKIYNMVI